jgi:hypothetical protein
MNLNGSCHCGVVRFCSVCGSALWVWDPRWPERVHPFASAIDTDLDNQGLNSVFSNAGLSMH